MQQPCRYCLNAFVCDELHSNNDLSYIDVPIADPDHRVLFRSGDGRKTGFVIEERFLGEWVYIGEFHPSFCPFCGRVLIENKVLNH